MSYSALPSLAVYCNSNVILKKYILFVVKLLWWLFPPFFFFIASPLSLLNLHHPSPYLHSPKPSYRSTHFSCPAPAHLFYHLPLFIFPQESQTLLVLSLSLSLSSFFVLFSMISHACHSRCLLWAVFLVVFWFG